MTDSCPHCLTWTPPPVPRGMNTFLATVALLDHRDNCKAEHRQQSTRIPADLTEETTPMTTTIDTLPAPQKVGDRAAAIFDSILADEDFDRLARSTGMYPECWSTFTGYPIVCEFDLARDSEPLFTEALRVLALKSAVYELTNGDEHAAELMVSPPVDEMVHAVLAQHTLCVRLQLRLGIELVHMTDRERFGWQRGDYTDQCYQAAGWGTPPERYWIDAPEVDRRLAILDTRYRSIGVLGQGRQVAIDFDTQPDPEPAVALAG